MSAPVVLGLDLSLTAAAAVVLPADWEPGDWNLPSLVVAPPEPEEDADAFHARRTGVIANALLRFAVEHCVTHVYVEDYAYSPQATRGRAVAELGGVVKDYFLRRTRVAWAALKQPLVPRPPHELIVHPVNMAAARKALLGHVPSKRTSGVAVKDYVNEKLARMGASFGTMDEGDAFVVANYGRALLGLPYVGVGG